MVNNNQPEIMTLRELAEHLRVHWTTIDRLIKSEKIPHFKIGSAYRFVRREIDDWIAAQSSQRR